MNVGGFRGGDGFRHCRQSIIVFLGDNMGIRGHHAKQGLSMFRNQIYEMKVK